MYCVQYVHVQTTVPVYIRRLEASFVKICFMQILLSFASTPKTLPFPP